MAVRNDLAVAHNVDPCVTAWPWIPGGGFGVKYADPGTKPTGTGEGVAFCGNTDIAVAHSADPYVTAWPWTPGGGFGVKYADPAAKPTGTGYGVAFSADYFFITENKSANMGSKMVAAGLI